MRLNLALFSIALLLSTLSGISVLSGDEHGARAMAELVRPFAFFCYFMLGQRLVKCYQYQLDVLLGSFTNFFIIWGLLTVVVSFVFSDLFDDFELMYGKIDNVVSTRLFAPFVNPYDMALAYILPLSLCFLLGKYIRVVLLVAIVVATQSRTGLLLASFAMFILCFRGLRIHLSGVVFLFSLLVSSVLFIIFSGILELLKDYYLVVNTLGLIDGSSTSLSKRIGQYDLLGSVKILGEGVIQSEDVIIENGYLFEMIKLGFLSVVSLLFYYAIPLVMAVLVFFFREINNLRIAVSVFVICFIVGSMSNVFIYQSKLSLLYWASVGALYHWTISFILPNYDVGGVLRSKQFVVEARSTC